VQSFPWYYTGVLSRADIMNIDTDGCAAPAGLWVMSPFGSLYPRVTTYCV